MATNDIEQEMFACLGSCITNEPCPLCNIHRDIIQCKDFCLYCQELQRCSTRAIINQARADYARTKGKQTMAKCVAITLTTTLPIEDEKLNKLKKCVNHIIKSKTYKLQDLVIKYELMPGTGLPHCHIYGLTTEHWRKDWTTLLRKKLGANVNVQFPKPGVETKKWLNYCQKTPTKNEVEFYEKNNIDINYKIENNAS